MPGHGVTNLLGLRLQLENSRLGEMPESSTDTLEIIQARSYQPASKDQQL